MKDVLVLLLSNVAADNQKDCSSKHLRETHGSSGFCSLTKLQECYRNCFIKRRPYAQSLFQSGKLRSKKKKAAEYFFGAVFPLLEAHIFLSKFSLASSAWGRACWWLSAHKNLTPNCTHYLQLNKK